MLLGLDFPWPGIARDPLVLFADPLSSPRPGRRGVVIVRSSPAGQHLLKVDAIRLADMAPAAAVRRATRMKLDSTDDAPGSTRSTHARVMRGTATCVEQQSSHCHLSATL
ncbi:hypothetical protein [Methylobacterium sp. B1]|uniref:hypothetical protein n=1 Tax=Methylobacterium sp. B1 TaxID=91459 RepID=UPI0011D1EE0B|nr:hypothetical protein [Methylobacterium sp. B1]